MAYNDGLLWLIYGLVYGIVACCFGLLGVPGIYIFQAQNYLGKKIETRALPWLQQHFDQGFDWGLGPIRFLNSPEASGVDAQYSRTLPGGELPMALQKPYVVGTLPYNTLL